MKTMKTLFTLMVLIIACSCSSLTPVDEYKTYNQSYKEMSKSDKEDQLITNFKKIPSFRNLKSKMAPGFLFYLNHPSDEKLKGRYRADFSGLLRLPYNVVIQVKDLTFSQLKKKVLAKYSKFFQRGVEDVDFRLIYKNYYVEVRGFVKNSGRYLVSRNESIDKVIDKAGGLRGDLKESFYKASIKQLNEAYSISLNQYFQDNFYSNAFTWTGGDSIFVSEHDEGSIGDSIPIVTVLGGVQSPGKVLFKDKKNIFYYLSKSGGVVDNLSFDRAMIVRNTDKGLKKIAFDISDIESLPNIQAQDVIVLQANSQTTTDRAFERTVQVSSILTALLLILLAI